MAVSITNIGSGSVVTTSTFSVRAPPGGTPAGAVIMCIIQDGAKDIGTMSDDVGNVYTNITAVQTDSLFAWFCGNALQVKRNQNFTYAQHTINAGAQGTLCYLTGTPPTHFLDPLVSVKAAGAFTTQPSLLTSGVPTGAGEAFIAAAAAVFTGTSVGTYNQDSGRGWASPPNPITLIPAGGTQTFSLGPGSQINVGTSALSYQPTFSLIPTTWGTFILALTSAEISQSTFNGAGGLTVNTLPPMQFASAEFDGSGSLSALTKLNIQDQAVFGGTGNLSAFGVKPNNISAIFNGTGSLTANIIKAPGSSSMNGAGNLSVSASVARAASAIFNGAGSFTAQPSGLAGGVRFDGSGRLVVTVFLQQFDSAVFAGTGSLTPTVFLQQFGSATFAGSGLLIADSNKVANGTIVFSGTGGLTLTVTLHEAAAATFAGVGSLTAAAALISFNAAQFNGSGSLSAIASQTLAGLAQFNGSGSFVASVTFANLAGQVFFNGSGNLIPTVFGSVFDTATFAGAGSLVATADIGLGAIAGRFQGAGSLQVVQVFGAVNASAQFDGAGSLAVLFNVIFTIPPFLGSGTLTADTFQVNVLNTVHAGLGALGEFPLGQEQMISPLYADFAVFSGAGSMTIDVVHHDATIEANFNGVGRMCVSADAWIGVAGQTTLEICPGPGPTENVVV